MTSFDDVYKIFLSKITDDMYMELTPEDTVELLNDLLLGSLHYFEFPRQNINDIDLDAQYFMVDLTPEEQNIIATYMIVDWLGQQLASVENVRMKYSGSDFKMTSQANHLSKLLSLLTESRRDSFHMQRLYKRRKIADSGLYASNWSSLMETSALE